MFGVFTGENFLVYVHISQKDDEFFRKNMQEKLRFFYNNCLLLKLVDLSYTRNGRVRDALFHRLKGIG